MRWWASISSPAQRAGRPPSARGRHDRCSRRPTASSWPPSASQDTNCAPGATDGTEAWRRDLGGAVVTQVATNAQTIFIGVAVPRRGRPGCADGRDPLAHAAAAPSPPRSRAAGDRLYLSGADGALYSFRQTGDPKPAWRYRMLEAIGQPVMSDAPRVLHADRQHRPCARPQGRQPAMVAVSSPRARRPARFCWATRCSSR